MTTIYYDLHYLLRVMGTMRYEPFSTLLESICTLLFDVKIDQHALIFKLGVALILFDCVFLLHMPCSTPLEYTFYHVSAYQILQCP